MDSKRNNGKNLKKTPHTRKERRDEKERKKKNYAIEKQTKRNVRNEIALETIVGEELFFSIYGAEDADERSFELENTFLLRSLKFTRASCGKKSRRMEDQEQKRSTLFIRNW